MANNAHLLPFASNAQLSVDLLDKGHVL